MLEYLTFTFCLKLSQVCCYNLKAKTNNQNLLKPLLASMYVSNKTLQLVRNIELTLEIIQINQFSLIKCHPTQLLIVKVSSKFWRTNSSPESSDFHYRSHKIHTLHRGMYSIKFVLMKLCKCLLSNCVNN